MPFGPKPPVSGLPPPREHLEGALRGCWSQAPSGGRERYRNLFMADLQKHPRPQPPAQPTQSRTPLPWS